MHSLRFFYFYFIVIIAQISPRRFFSYHLPKGPVLGILKDRKWYIFNSFSNPQRQ